MPKITDAMKSDHRRCDDMFAQAEEAASKGDWEQAGAMFEQFEDAVEHHFIMEETVLFPAYTMKTKLSSVTDALVNEHMQMRIMIFEMGEAIKAHNQEQFLGQADTLITVMQQHNRKEETKMYTMADSSMRAEADELLSKMGMAG